MVHDSSDNICYPDKSYRLIVAEMALNFEETLNFCNRVGSMVVISSKEIAHEVNKTLKSFALDDELAVFTGHTDMEVEGEWVVHGTEQKMTWHNWKGGYPKNWGDNQNCAVMYTPDFMFFDDNCHTPFAPVCYIAEVHK